MRLFFPTINVKNVTDISIELLKSLGVKAVFLDVDNTIAKQDCMELICGAEVWLEEVLKSNIEVVIVSNNFKKRVKPFSDKLGVPFVSFAQKPLPYSFFRAKLKLKNKNINKSECVAIGDQIFTDVLGANFNGIRSILTQPVFRNEGRKNRIRRKLENSIRCKFESQGV